MVKLGTLFKRSAKGRNGRSNEMAQQSKMENSNQETYPEEKLEAGTQAPEFALMSTSGSPLSLSELRGRPVILAFYPADWSPVCGDQMTLYNEILPEFERFGAQVCGISVDSEWSHRAFSNERNLRFSLLADFEPKGEVARRYGVYNQEYGQSHRALFVIDSDGIIRWSYIAPPGVNPGANGILDALEMISTEN
jgi:peroxiredoxin